MPTVICICGKRYTRDQDLTRHKRRCTAVTARSKEIVSFATQGLDIDFGESRKKRVRVSSQDDQFEEMVGPYPL